MSRITDEEGDACVDAARRIEAALKLEPISDEMAEAICIWLAARYAKRASTSLNNFIVAAALAWSKP